MRLEGDGEKRKRSFFFSFSLRTGGGAMGKSLFFLRTVNGEQLGGRWNEVIKWMRSLRVVSLPYQRYLCSTLSEKAGCSFGIVH